VGLKTPVNQRQKKKNTLLFLASQTTM